MLVDTPAEFVGRASASTRSTVMDVITGYTRSVVVLKAESNLTLTSDVIAVKALLALWMAHRR